MLFNLATKWFVLKTFGSYLGLSSFEVVVNLLAWTDIRKTINEFTQNYKNNTGSQGAQKQMDHTI